MLWLPDDIWIDILSYLDSLQDLRAVVLSSRPNPHTFNEFRPWLISTVVRNKGQRIESSRDARQQVQNLLRHVRPHAVDDTVSIWRALEPRTRTNAHYIWTLHLAAMYARQGASEERRALLDSVCNDILTMPANSTYTEAAQKLGRAHLTRSAQRVLLVATKNLPLPQRLSFEKRALQRVLFAHRSFFLWSQRVADSLVAMNKIDDAIVLAHQLYKICFDSDHKRESLFWARLLAKFYRLCGRQDEALESHRRVLRHIRPSHELHERWARELIRAYIQAERIEDAIALKAEEWTRIPVRYRAFRYWGQELASLYRQAGQGAQAVRTVESMYQQIESQVPQINEFSLVQASAEKAAKDLADAYECAGMMDKATSMRHKRWQMQCVERIPCACPISVTPREDVIALRALYSEAVWMFHRKSDSSTDSHIA